MRTPFFALAVLTMALVVAFELSTLAFLRNATVGDESAPGMGGPYLALLDGILLYSVIVTSLGYLSVKTLRLKALIARITAVATLVLSFLGTIGSFVLILWAFFAIILMLGLLMAVPFGTLAYFAAYADFPKNPAVGALSFIMLLKLFCLIMLALTHPGYLRNKGLMMLFAFSLLATWLTSFLIALPPGFLSSITDAVGALITAVIAFIWLIVMFIVSIIALRNVLRFRVPGREV